MTQIQTNVTSLRSKWQHIFRITVHAPNSQWFFLPLVPLELENIVKVALENILKIDV